jgi:hypothetical protein
MTTPARHKKDDDDKKGGNDNPGSASGMSKSKRKRDMESPNPAGNQAASSGQAGSSSVNQPS